MSDERAPSEGEAAARIEASTRLLDAETSMAIAACDGGDPWIGRVFFVEDEPSAGRLDLCCSLVQTPHTLAMFGGGATIAFIVGGGSPDRWINGAGTAELIDDDEDAAAIAKRLADRSTVVPPFLDAVSTRAVRIHVATLRLTDLGADPPVTEFTFE